jgi:MoxR-like ATPase
MSKDLNEMLAETLINNTANKLHEIISDKVNNIQTELEQKISKIEKDCKGKVEKLECYISGKPLVVNLGTLKAPKNKMVHKAFDTVIKVLQSCDRINKNIMLVGEAGSGKSSLCADVASALNLQFYPMSVGLQTTKSDLIGFISATGEYMTTPLRQAFENGGVLLLDEFDATHAGVVTILNSMLANDICSFPDKIVNKHKDFVCIVACNTYCKGGSLEYIGRNRLDSATLDRFITVNVGYDEMLEDTLTRNSDWLKVVRQMRDNIKNAGLKVVISPRASMQGADLLDAGFSIEEVLEMVIYKGVSDDVKTKIVKDVNFNIFNKKQKESTKSKTGNAGEPMKVDIDFNSLSYTVSNIISDTSIIKRTDWKGEYSIYFSTTNGYDSKLDDKGLYLNYGRNKLREAKTDHINKLIRELNTYGDTIDTEFQPIEFNITWGDNNIKVYAK